MSVYDVLPKGSQVKCWDCESITKQVGDSVYSYAPTYIVLLHEGGYVRVEDGRIVEIVEEKKPYYPEDFPDMPCVDKWGGKVANKDDLEGRCALGYHYYYQFLEKEEK